MHTTYYPLLQYSFLVVNILTVLQLCIFTCVIFMQTFPSAYCLLAIAYTLFMYYFLSACCLDTFMHVLLILLSSYRCNTLYKYIAHILQPHIICTLLVLAAVTLSLHRLLAYLLLILKVYFLFSSLQVPVLLIKREC